MLKRMFKMQFLSVLFVYMILNCFWCQVYGYDNNSSSAVSQLVYPIVTGPYEYHLQGITTDTDNQFLYWSYTTKLVKTDFEGNVANEVAVDAHHGDLTYYNGKIYVAVELGSNQGPDGDNFYIYVYDSDLNFERSIKINQLVYGLDGISYGIYNGNERFMICRQLPYIETQQEYDANNSDPTYTTNVIYEYDTDFNFIAEHSIPTGYTNYGIQSLEYDRDTGGWWAAAYGNSRPFHSEYTLYKLAADMQLVQSYKYDTSVGLVSLGNNQFLTTGNVLDANGLNLGYAYLTYPSEEYGMVKDEKKAEILHYTMDSVADGILVDSSIRRIDGDMVGTAAGADVNNVANGARSFDALDDQVDLNSGNVDKLNDDWTGITDEVSLSLWVKINADANSNNNNQFIAGCMDSTGDYITTLEYNRWNYFIFRVKLADGSTESVWVYMQQIQKGRWYHLAGTHGYYGAKLYVDGELKGNVPGGGKIKEMSAFTIGYDPYPQPNPNNSTDIVRDRLNGCVDDLYVHNRTLNDDQVAVLAAKDENKLNVQHTKDIWTANWREQIFRNTLKPDNAPDSIDMTVARNEFEPAQIILRSSSSFSINSVTFSDLISGSNTIASSNFKYNFVEYFFGVKNTNDILNPVRKGPEYFPEQLSNNLSINVECNMTQPIWVKLYVPKETAAGNYAGIATVNTSLGNFQVPVNVEVKNVTIPDSKDGNMRFEFWNQLVKCFEPVQGKDVINEQFGYEPYSTQWWSLMDKFAVLMKENRMNSMIINAVDLLIDGGTTIDTTGQINFNWSKFDQFVQFFIDRGVAKQLGGAHLCIQDGPDDGLPNNDGIRDWLDVEVIEKNADGVVNKNWKMYDDGGKSFLDQYLPALYQHLNYKGWNNIWYQHIADEPTTGMVTTYKQVAGLVHQYCPGMKIGDAINADRLSQLVGYMDNWIAIEDVYENNRTTYDERKNLGEEIWMYTCAGPQGNWLNRFIDSHVYQMELLGWLCYERGIPQYLHWGLMEWGVWGDYNNNTWNETQYLGDAWSIYPDTANSTVKSSIRVEAAREACEDYELFKIYEDLDSEGAMNLANSIVQSGNQYTADINIISTARSNLVKLAAGENPYQTAYWSFDEGSGSTVADFWGLNAGTINGAVWTNDAKSGSALYFDGNSNVNIGEADIQGSWTASMWVKKSQNDLTCSALMSSEQSALVIEQWDSTEKVGFTITGVGDYTFDYIAPVDEWVHLTYVCDGINMSLYVNGAFYETISNVTASCPMQYLGYYSYKGIMDEVKVYSRALTDIEIARAAYWSFDEGSGSTVADSWGLNAGTINGAAWTSDAKSGSALYFDGNSYVNIGNADIQGSWTASMWVKKSQNDLTCSALMSSEQSALVIEQWDSTEKVGFTITGVGDYTFDYIAPVDEWVHLTYVCDGINMSLYVNGAFYETISNVTASCPMQYLGYYSYKGIMDEVKVYSRALTQEEIAALMQQV